MFSEEYYKNQREFTKQKYLESCEYLSVNQYKKPYTEENKRIDSVCIDFYFGCLDKYPEYVEKYCKNIGGHDESRNPDHDYAARMSGIYSTYILSLFSQYYYMMEEKENE